MQLRRQRHAGLHRPLQRPARLLAAGRHRRHHCRRRSHRITGAGASNTLDNTRGSISSAGSITVAANRIVNSAGTLLSGTRQSIEAEGMTGDGRVLSRIKKK
ncbi:hypothetical protein ACU4HD_31425 [Cupriavidus basilensis]